MNANGYRIPHLLIDLTLAALAIVFFVSSGRWAWLAAGGALIMLISAWRTGRPTGRIGVAWHLAAWAGLLGAVGVLLFGG